MSSKKQLREERRQKEGDVRRGPSTATLFILIIAAALLAVGIGAALLGDGGGRGSGEVWSAEHGHWH